ncbi:TolC family protein [Nibrella viscosa]|uniref:TolC family protein n=1 Tax=Nibrella viscosa TaxID=1084524 RepID=UPI0031F00516
MRRCVFVLVLLRVLTGSVYAQTPAPTLAEPADLTNCIQYALQNQPNVRRALIDQEITERTVRSALAAWYPQIGFGYNIQHFLKLPVTLIPDQATGERRPVALGARNTSSFQFTLNQNIFSRDLLLANRTADVYRAQATQATVSNKIDVVVDVSRAFYDLITTQWQVTILDQDIARLLRSQKDTRNQYESGLVDKTDVQRATIALNNARAQLKQYREQVSSKYQTLKQLMGYPPTVGLRVAYDTLQLTNEVLLDTNQMVNPQNRIEYQLLQTQGLLLDANVLYNKQAYLPTVSAVANYNFLYQNNTFSQLYSQSFPNSLIGLTLGMPIFQGGRRVQEIRRAELQVRRLQWDLAALTSAVDAEYARALADYKGNLANYYALHENLLLAQDVYRILSLQYRAGIKGYLDVVIAEADLRTARLSLYNALYQVLASKLEVQRALGAIRF